MYTSFFQLKQVPFSIAPDPRYLFMSERHREALAHLLYGVGGGGGFVLLTGEIGAGKTTVCRCFIEQIPAHCKLAYIFNPKLSVDELLLSVCEEFGIAAPQGGVKKHVDAINAYLLASHAQGLNNVLIIDEAQNLSADVLEQLRLLTNLETSERKLLQIILIGQPELRAMLARPELEQLAQRVIARYHLGPLSEEETAGYVRHRLAVAGAQATPFAGRVLRRIHRLSHGVPRRINLLCDRALLGAYVENRREVTRAILDKAAAEVFAPGGARHGARRWPSVLAGALAGVLVTGAAAWQFLPHSAPAAPRAAAAPRPAAGSPRPAPSPAPAPAVADVPAGNAAALRQLASLWQVSLPEGEPCQVALKLNLRCYAGKGGLDELRRLDRPAVLSLHGEGAAPVYALLTALDATGAALRIDGKDSRIGLDALAARLDGAFVTYWRAPRGWRDVVALGDRGPDVDWLAARLAQLNGAGKPAAQQPLDASTQGLLRAFQQREQLQADGVAGPKTFMRLMRPGREREPALLAVAAPAVFAAGK